MTEIDRVFNRYAASLEIPHYPHGLVARRAEQLVQKLKRMGWAVQGYQVIGSYARGTAIRPMEANNVDMMVELDEGAYRQWHNPEATVHIMRVMYEQLCAAYRETVVRHSREIRVQFPEFRVDVIPALHWHTGRYLIPDAAEERWLYSDPDGLRQRIHNLDQENGSLILPMIKIIKDWNRSAGSLLDGMHIESMVMRRYDGTCRLGSMINSLPIALCDFFLALPSMLETRIGDPVHNQRVDLYLDGTKNRLLRNAAQDAAMQAAAHAGMAYERLHADQPEEAMLHFGSLLHQEFLVPQR